ncbi:hypothetical protein LX77_03558 [Gelidibacter algens]|uniref:Sugar lactone lactonase YvrE n=1 Tax=Gelidibacter algens TaxID=49280 RepID=A0A1A7QYW1_9FLAO|nr:hypothetical protein [Gelidibacter algens]OBX24458.1 hypothetical protein A9996_15035 [Gelidibacter algens]RAJ19199.1 hypothetical protein LX77_03558 [Gelidibacter algens]
MKNKMKNLKTTILAMFLFWGISAIAQTAKTVDGFNHVESVATDGKYLYAADIGKELNPTAKDGDGQILKLDKNGKILDKTFVKETLNAPKGIAIYKGILYINDIDRLLAIDLKTGNKLYEIDFSKDTSFLNDIAVWDKTTLYVSATDMNKLFKVNLTDKSYSQIKTDKTIAGINGLYCNKKTSKLYVNGFGSENKPNGVVGYINLKNNQFKQLTELEGYYDGICIYDDVLYFSNWVAFEKKGIILSMKLSTGKLTVVKIPEPISGPADFTIFKDQLVIPGMMDGTLLFVTIKKITYYIN